MRSDSGSLRIYLDANVFLAYVRAEPERVETVEQILSDAVEGRHSLVTSTLSIVEVSYVSDEELAGTDAEDTAIDQLWQPHSPITLIESSIPVMRRARRLLHEAKRGGFGLKPPDAIHLASAMSADADDLFTYEAERTRARWQQLSGMEVSEPFVHEPRFDLGS